MTIDELELELAMGNWDEEIYEDFEPYEWDDEFIQDEE